MEQARNLLVIFTFTHKNPTTSTTKETATTALSTQRPIGGKKLENETENHI